MSHVQKFEISPHDRFFLHGHRPCVRDKYEVCTGDQYSSLCTIKWGQSLVRFGPIPNTYSGQANHLTALQCIKIAGGRAARRWSVVQQCASGGPETAGTGDQYSPLWTSQVMYYQVGSKSSKVWSNPEYLLWSTLTALKCIEMY